MNFLRISFILIILNSALLPASELFKSAASCADCHETIYKQWSASVHANATIQKDPLYRGMYEWAVKDSKGKLKKRCTECHAPLSSYFKNDDQTTAFNREGITCIFCHGAKNIEKIHSAKDVSLDFSTIYSDKPATNPDAHPTAHREYFSNSQLCLVCHAEMMNPKELAVCSTGDEWKKYNAVHQKECIECHMPIVDQLRSHQFAGSHLADPPLQAVSLSLKYSPSRHNLEVTLENILAGHALPTGTPLRMVILKVTGKNKKGEIIWQNWQENPFLEDKSAVFMKLLADAEGNSPVPPWRASQFKYYRVLDPKIPEKIIYSLNDQPDIYKIEAKLLYRLAPLKILKKFNITDSHFTEAKLLNESALIINQ